MRTASVETQEDKIGKLDGKSSMVSHSMEQQQWIGSVSVSHIVMYVSGEDTPVSIHSFAFTSGTRKEEVNNNNKE